ncbi:MAG: glycosyltransferase, partial [Candidatus Promineifilaceae bacterium]
AHSHLLVVPSSYEGFGIVYLEGMGFGLPAIAGRDGAAHEIITDGVDGFLVDDAATLRQHLHSLHHNRTQLSQMSHAAQTRFVAHPTWPQSMSQIRNFLLEQCAV